MILSLIHTILLFKFEGLAQVTTMVSPNKANMYAGISNTHYSITDSISFYSEYSISKSAIV